MDDFFDEDAPLNAEARAEFSAIMRHTRIWDLKDAADDVARMHRSLLPTPTLDVELTELADDVNKRQEQLLLLWQVERKFRLRLQDNLRRSLELLAG